MRHPQLLLTLPLSAVLPAPWLLLRQVTQEFTKDAERRAAAAADRRDHAAATTKGGLGGLDGAEGLRKGNGRRRGEP